MDFTSSRCGERALEYTDVSGGIDAQNVGTGASILSVRHADRGPFDGHAYLAKSFVATTNGLREGIRRGNPLS
jgi:hypothetical protein